MADGSRPNREYAHRHLRFGWWSMLVFAGLGLLLETLQGFKVGAYLDVSNETRRMLWRLAHAHGTLLGVVHVLFGLTLRTEADRPLPRARLISRTLTLASLARNTGATINFEGGVNNFTPINATSNQVVVTADRKHQLVLHRRDACCLGLLFAPA